MDAHTDEGSRAAQRALRDAFGAFATGITVITAVGRAGNPVGLTVNSFSSVSLDPPLVAWSLRNASPWIASFAPGRRCSIHVLRADQEPLARHFALTGIDRFAGVDWRAGGSGVPVIDGVLARFDCLTEAVHEAGDHQLLLARVEHHVSQPGSPLLFAGGQFRAL